MTPESWPFLDFREPDKKLSNNSMYFILQKKKKFNVFQIGFCYWRNRGTESPEGIKIGLNPLLNAFFFSIIEVTNLNLESMKEYYSISSPLYQNPSDILFSNHDFSERLTTFSLKFI